MISMAMPVALLMRAKGLKARAVSTSIPNASLPPSILAWSTDFSRTYDYNEQDSFIIIDTSSPKHLDKIVRFEKIEAIIDHHLGFEDYWAKKIGEKSQIKFIGAARTLVYEAWEQAGLADQISPTSAKLLTCGILDNTLNFSAKITTQRDREAYDKLISILGFSSDWSQTYFSSCIETILNDIPAALKNDIKLIDFKTLNKQLAAGQITIWDGSDFLNRYRQDICDTLGGMKPRLVYEYYQLE